ncbi:acetylornithine deacetylase [Limimaricola litoreus]|nr:acetylornithine deacetylase [Limimaricola litoreus]
MTAHPRLTEAKDHLEALVAFDTVSRNPNRPLIDHMAAHLEALGADITILPDETGKKANLVARFGPADKPGLVLSGHTDVVPVDGEAWTSDPFSLEEREGKLYGRGTCDMKGFAACVMATASDLAQTDLERPVYLCFSHDEEVGCLGAPAIAEHLKAQPVLPEFAIIGEPSMMKLVTGQKGKIAMRATVTGSGGHSSFAPQHVNAIEYAGRAISMIQERGTRFCEEGPFDRDFTVGHATMLTTMVEGGVATNITPDLCAFTFELRSIAQVDAEAEMQALITQVQETLLPAMKAISAEADIRFERIFSYPAMGDATNDRAFQRYRPILPEWGGKVSYGSEGGVFEIQGGIPSIIVGPGSIEQAHLPDEFIEISQLEACLHFLDEVTGMLSRASTDMAAQ